MPPVGACHKTAPHAPQEPSLPSNFTELRAILDENVSPGSMVNVMGLARDCRLPIPTRGSDHKCTITLFDLSLEEDANVGILVNIFRPEADMPEVSAADIIVLTNLKVQRFRNDPLSLISHKTTSICVYTASKIPRPPKSAQIALAPPLKRGSHTPSAQESFYVSHLYHKIGKCGVPDEEEFKERAARSLNVKDKFKLLQDIRDGTFCDLIAQVAREPHALMYDMVTLYVSDYTENPNLHPQIWEGLNESGSGLEDPYGYTSGGSGVSKKEWVGPYGKMSIQITCYEPHASVIRSDVSAGQWVALRNIQIKYGHDGRYLEGYLREDRGAASAKISVEVLDVQDRETVDPRLKDAIRRFRDYSKKKKSQIQDIKSAQAAGQKRKASESVEQEKPSLGSKKRRAMMRAAQDQEEKEKRISEDLRLGLNDKITCEYHEVAYSTIESLLQPIQYKTAVNDQDVTLDMPFTCAKHRARVRVVDFYPPDLKDFACSRKPNVFDMLSDNEGDTDLSSDDDEDEPSTSRIWEWRFALQLEDLTSPSKKNSGPRPRVWVFVDNAEAQCLTSLDATDLRQDPRTLATLRERMFTLWGELEEHKSRAADRKRERAKGKGKQGYVRPGTKPPLRLEKPRLESSDVEDDGEEGETPVSNRPFSCCIKQYGVYDKNEEGARWVRCFGLFGTKISC